ncbi:MAG: MinD/ParA family protein [Phycisphaerales bacterium]|nr:MinD/ParA family protein [Phycisphaerales bacterium]
MNDQAATLRNLVEASPVRRRTEVVSRPEQQGESVWSLPSTRRSAKAIAVTSGKGGVGKSNMAVNLAVAMAQSGRRVVLLDADLGLANTDVLCGITPRRTIEHVLDGASSFRDIMVPGPGGFMLVPGASGVAGLADLEPGRRRHLLRELVQLEQEADVILIDTGAGIGSSVVGFAVASERVVVVCTPEPTSITDAYGMIKSLRATSDVVDIHLAVNMAEDEAEGRAVHGRIEQACATFLRTPVHLAGVIPRDPLVPLSVRNQLPFLISSPNCPAAQQIRLIARGLLGEDVKTGSSAMEAGFFQRFTRWLGFSDELEQSRG